jgi:hypothetical protein
MAVHMSRFSVLCEWTLAEDYLGGSMYLISIEKNLHIMMIRPSRVEAINTLVHEINECEVFNLLRTKFLEDVGGNPHKIHFHVNKKMIKKYPWLFTCKARELEISHIISPYGIGNCCMPRKSFRLKMGKTKERKVRF